MNEHRRYPAIRRLAVAVTLSSMAFVGTAVSSATPPAGATTVSPAACTGWEASYIYRDKVKSARSTSIASDWMIPNRGSVTMTYNQTASYTNSVSGTVTASGEANAIIAGASVSVGVTLGRTWSQSKSWSYSATVSKDASHAYRLHLYHYAWSFEVMKRNTRVCNGTVQHQNLWTYWKTANHAPIKSSSANVWKIDKKAV